MVEVEVSVESGELDEDKEYVKCKKTMLLQTR